MSLSDFSLSSPRKPGAGKGNKSITYDEEFERFLNDTSESEFSTNRFKKSADTPWWMKEDDKNRTGGSTKSFMKQTKPTSSINSTINKPISRLAKTPEIDEEEEDKKHKFSKSKSPQSSNKYSDDFDEDPVPKLSLELNSSISSNHLAETKAKKSLEYYDHDDYIKEEDEDEMESSEQMSTSRKSQQSSHRNSREFYNNKTFDNNGTINRTVNDTHGDTAAATNLLSKVMFMDSLDSGGIAAANATGSGGNLTIKKDNNVHFASELINAGSTNQASRLGTQARLDLADLEMVYRNLATDDSGLNTLIKTTHSSTIVPRQDSDNQSKPPVSPRKLSESHRSNSSEFLDSNRNNNSNLIGDSAFGLQAIHAITSELENRALEEILRQMDSKKTYSKNRQSADKTQFDDSYTGGIGSAGWPPKKYQHIKGTGYGTKWSPTPVKHSYLMNSTFSNNSQTEFLNYDAPPKRSRSENNKPKTNNKMTFNTNFNDSLAKSHQIEEIKSQERINNLQNELINRLYEQESKAKDMRIDYERQLNELRSKILNLTNELNEKNEKLLAKPSNLMADSDDEKDAKESKEKIKKLEEKIELLEKNLSEQDKLISGYQLENERLYADLKHNKEEARKERIKFEEEIQLLKLNVIQERINNEKQQKTENNIQTLTNKTKPFSEDQPNRFLPTMSQSNLDSAESELKISQLESKLKEQAEKIKQLEKENLNLTKRVDYYDKNQKQIEMDMKLIEMKNKEIHRLKEKLKFVENGRNAPECMREIKQLKNQLKEMETLVKRLKGKPTVGVGTNIDSNAVSLSIDFYEKKIEQLEADLKEKVYDLDRSNRIWQQKYFMFQELFKDDQPGTVDSRINSLEKNYLLKIDSLQIENLKFKNLLNELELEIEEKNNEIENLRKSNDSSLDKLKVDYQKKELELEKRLNEILKKKENEIHMQKKKYEPGEFATIENNSVSNSSNVEDKLNNVEFLKEIFSETEGLKLKLNNAQNELRLRDKENELKLEQMKNKYENKIDLLTRKHKYEMEKLIGIFTGTVGPSAAINSAEFELDGVETIFDDPIRMRILFESKDRHKKTMETIAKQNETNRQLNEKVNQTKMFRDRCVYLEQINSNLKEQLESLNDGLNEARKSYSPEMRDFQNLKDKLKQIEIKYVNREKELSNLMLTGDKSSILSSISLSDNLGLTGNNTTEIERLTSLVRNYEAQLKIKNKEIEKFKSELDTMLQLLQSL